ncbi:MAG: DNA photolyase [Gammaproteobacteria bacterium]|nr:DNA photolyase [Gammaproteobacteria bacterium]
MKFSAVYIEREISEHDSVKRIIAKVREVPIITIERYGEVFNRTGQNFRIQKRAPALILAKKHGKTVLPAPEGYGFEQGRGFYFSHMLNCLYDCRYCFLQGMYRSAHYVLFVNFEDFMTGIDTEASNHEGKTVFYSGYDCDSLAMEPISAFCESFIPFFAKRPKSILEIRTKSTQVRQLLGFEAVDNCIIAMSFTPEAASNRWEHKVPTLGKRLQAIKKLQLAGWKVAVRFEPVIADKAVEADYDALFKQIFSVLSAVELHSVSLGEFRLPVQFHKALVKLYPEEDLLARETAQHDGILSLVEGGEVLLRSLEDKLFSYVDRSCYYRCA